MDDYDAIKETIYHYFEGYQTKDRGRLERAFAVDIAHIKGYAKNKDGDLELWSLPMKEMIDIWVSDDDTLPKLDYGKILSIQIYSDVAATALFNCSGTFFDTFQLVKLDGEWRIANKFYVDY
jgi:hypothetical protein